MNETLRAIAERYSCRAFTERIPEDGELMAIANAGIQAPSGMNRQGWQVIVVKDGGLIADMEAEGLAFLEAMEDKSMYNRIMERGGRLFYNAPRMIVIAISPETYRPGAELIDCGIVAQNMVIAASSLGLASLHCGFAAMAFAGARADEFKKRLGFPQGYEIGMAVLLGYPVKPVPPHEPDASKITVIG